MVDYDNTIMNDFGGSLTDSTHKAHTHPHMLHLLIHGQVSVHLGQPGPVIVSYLI